MPPENRKLEVLREMQGITRTWSNNFELKSFTEKIYLLLGKYLKSEIIASKEALLYSVFVRKE